MDNYFRNRMHIQLAENEWRMFGENLSEQESRLQLFFKLREYLRTVRRFRAFFYATEHKLNKHGYYDLNEQSVKHSFYTDESHQEDLKNWMYLYEYESGHQTEGLPEETAEETMEDEETPEAEETQDVPVEESTVEDSTSNE